MAVTPKSSWPWVKALLHSVFDQRDTDAVHAQFDRILDALADKLPAVAAHLETACHDVLAFTAFPKEIWRRTRSTRAPTIPRTSEATDRWRRPRAHGPLVSLLDPDGDEESSIERSPRYLTGRCRRPTWSRRRC
jgi:hypothetical protein